jgi:hypothetical protein
MDTPILPPEKRTSFPSGTMVFIIFGIIVASIVLFLALHPR